MFLKRQFFGLMLSFLVMLTSLNVAQITSAGDGGWNQTTTWTGGVIPGPTDNVVIDHTVTLDVPDAVCNNLTINVKLKFATDGSVSGITVNGDIVINSGGLLRVESRDPAGAANSFVEHTLNLKGNLTNAGTIDFRGGSNSGGTSNGVLLTLDGTTNSTITLTSATYQSSVEEFNSITINKTSGAKVFLEGGNLFMSNNSTVGKTILTFTEGIIETGMNHWVNLATSTSNTAGGSATSHVNGYLGRGMSNGGTADRFFEIGDGSEFRPIKVKCSTSGGATGHYVWAKVFTGDANTGSSTLLNGIDRVSSFRYYQAGYANALVGPAPWMRFDLFTLNYNSDDGVLDGNTDLRVAYSPDDRVTWNGFDATNPDTTDLSSLPGFMAHDTLATPIQIDAGSSILLTLADATGGVNPIPVELTSFQAFVNGNKITLNWSTATETNNSGFEVERSIENRPFERIGFVQGSVTTTESRSYSFIDNAISNGKISYRLKQIDLDGSFSYSNTVLVEITSVQSFELKQNFPNPFNPSTRIDYSINETGLVKLSVYNLLGEIIGTIVNQTQEAGAHSVTFNASNLESGIYFYKLESGNQIMTKKMILLK